MTVAAMRKELCKVYDTDRWFNRVVKMPDNQVTAIYYSFLKRGKFNNPSSFKKRKSTRTAEKYHQMTIFEYLMENGDER